MATILGIDLGTTNSSCAICDGQTVTLIPNERGQRVTPSIIAFAESGEILVGDSAKNQALLNPQGTFRQAKRLMGTKERLTSGTRSLLPEEVAARILKRLKDDAESYLNESINAAVITVPAYFSEAQRRATREAGGLAGLDVKRLLNEPTAAAVAWAWSVQKSFASRELEEKVLVYDLGGGTFDATVLAMRGSACRVLATAGDAALGGMDFDRKLLEWASQRLGSDTTASSRDSLSRHRLLDLVERAKIELSIRDSVDLALPFGDENGTRHPVLHIDRRDFESVIEADIDRTLEKVLGALREAHLEPSAIDHVVLSGGSSRLPLVRRRLSALIGRGGEGRVNPEEVVAQGAAIFGFALLGGSPAIQLEDAVSRSFGVEIDHDDFIVIVPRNTTLPLSRRRLFTTVADGQDSVEIHVLQGEAEKASANLSLGRFLLGGIRTGRRGEPRIEVEFSIDDDEILHVAARDLDTGAVQTVTLLGAAETAATPLRLVALAERLKALEPFAAGDRSLAGELEDAATGVKGLIDRLTAVQSAGSLTTATDETESGRMAIILEALIAELEARRQIANSAVSVV